MAKRILICTELSPAELRAKALTADTARERKRGLAIAHVMEGLSRSEAGRLTDQGDQSVKDAIRRYNAEGFAGLKDRPHTGRPRKLDDERREELHDIVLKGPDVERDHLSSYTREDVAKIAQEKWGVSYAVTSIGRILKETGLSRQKMRPSHPKKDPEAVEAFLKNAWPT
jgi:transposase